MGIGGGVYKFFFIYGLKGWLGVGIVYYFIIGLEIFNCGWLGRDDRVGVVGF